MSSRSSSGTKSSADRPTSCSADDVAAEAQQRAVDEPDDPVAVDDDAVRGQLDEVTVALLAVAQRVLHALAGREVADQAAQAHRPVALEDRLRGAAHVQRAAVGGQEPELDRGHPARPGSPARRPPQGAGPRGGRRRRSGARPGPRASSRARRSATGLRYVRMPSGVEREDDVVDVLDQGPVALLALRQQPVGPLQLGRARRDPRLQLVLGPPA